MATNSFIANVNTLAGMENILAELSANIQTFKKLESNELGINKVVELETGIITIRDNISKLILVANANNELLGIANKLDDLLQVNTNINDFFFEYEEAKVLIEELTTSSNEISSNMELALNLLFSARENIELLNDYKTYDETNKLRFEAIETKEITNYTKILTRLNPWEAENSE